MFTRQPLLSPDVELKLRDEMLPLWTRGLKANEIAEELKFGEGDYLKLKPYHVWFYRQKFGLHRRKKGIPKGKSRYSTKFDEIMLFNEFDSLLNQNCPKSDDVESKQTRAYCILSYWSPLRKSEILERCRRDFKVSQGFLVINLFRKKKTYSKFAKKEPLFIPTVMPLLDEVLDWLKHFKPTERPFAFTGHKAWSLMKQTLGVYPHYTRFNFISKAIENGADARTIISELLDDVCVDVNTITKYVMTGSKHRGAISRRELEAIRTQGTQGRQPQTQSA